MTKTYAVGIIGVSRFLYSDAASSSEGSDPFLLPLLEDEVHLRGGLRSAIIADSIDGELCQHHG